jgi:hypothetical protein
MTWLDAKFEGYREELEEERNTNVGGRTGKTLPGAEGGVWNWEEDGET